MSFSTLPESAEEWIGWSWSQVQPYYTDLSERPLTQNSISAWLADWSQLKALTSEALSRLSREAYSNIDASAAMTRRQQYYQAVYQPAQAIDHDLRERWLASGLAAPGYERILARLQTEKSLFCAANQELEAREGELVGQYYQMISGWWANPPVDPHAPRAEREQVWRKRAALRLQDRPAINAIWSELMSLRRQMAFNSGYKNFLEYQWARMQRSDYTPTDCVCFHQAVERIGVPAASQVYARRQHRLGLAALRPWDVDAILPGVPDLGSNHTAAQLAAGCSRIFYHIDPVLGQYFDTLHSEGMLDLEPRPNKSPGGFTLYYAVTRRAFIALNLQNTWYDILGLIHECGHAFTALETRQRSFLQLTLPGGQGGGERNEFTSQAMELLALPYLAASKGGFYSEEAAAWAEIRHLEDWVLLFFPHVALNDAFSHWLYTHPEEATQPQSCEDAYSGLYRRFYPALDWSGLEDELAVYWHGDHILFGQPLFYIEYAIALLAALQVWQNPEGAKAYRRALALGGTGATTRELYAAAGAVFGFDEPFVSAAVNRIEARIRELSSTLQSSLSEEPHDP